MEWRDAVVVLSVLIGLARLLVNLVAFARSKDRVRLEPNELFSWRSIQTTSKPDAAPRQIRHQHRQPATQLPRPYGNCTPEVLARSIRCSGRVPLDRLEQRMWHLSAWQTTKEIFLPSPTNPKPAFALTDWEYEPITPTGPAKHYPYCGGSMLRLSLHRHENRSHLKRSLKADKSGRRARRLVVIASVQDMFEPTSLVRCIVVNSYTLQLEEGGHAVAIRTADPLSVEEPTVHRCEQKDVPADALWLIVPKSNYRTPSTFWGQMPERHNKQAMPSDSTTQESDDIGDEDFVKKRMTFVWRTRLALWLFMGLMMWPIAWSTLNLIPQVSGPTPVLVFWGLAYVIPLIAALFYQAGVFCRAWCWRRRDGQTSSTWRSGTEECLIMGAPLRFGPVLSEKEWKEYYAHVFQTSDKAPTGSA